MNPNRRNKIDVVLGKLSRMVPGVEQIQSDDWDSIAIDVFVDLKGTKFKFDERLQDTYKRIKKVCEPYTVIILDRPTKRRGYVPACCGQPVERPDLGYDKKTLKFELYIGE